MQQAKQKQRKKKSREFWKKHINRCSESGLTQKEYCLRNDLGSKSLTYWKGKLKKENNDVSFIHLPIAVSSVPPSQAPLKLICNDKYTVEVGDNFTSDTLKRLLHTIEAM